MRYHSGDQLSHREQSKLDKEKLQAKEVKRKEPNRSIAGLNNPAVFGKFNTNFNKCCL